MSQISLELEQVEDVYTRENFRRVKEFLEDSPFAGARLYELTLTKAETKLKVPHGLSFAPQDVIITRLTGAGSLTIHFDLIDRINLVVTSTGALAARLIIGTLGES